MKKNIIVFIVLSLSFILAQGQKIGYIDINYINKKINYSNFYAKLVFLSDRGISFTGK